MKRSNETIEIENINHPGQVQSVDASKHAAMKRAYLAVLPTAPPGLTADEIRERILPHLPESLFPGGAKAGWWAKAVQLDLEAKGTIVRESSRPLRWRKV